MAKKQKTRITAKRVQENEEKPFVLPGIEHKAEEDNDGFEPGSDLKPRHRLFVKAYIGPAGGCGSKAAEMAGYASENRKSLSVTAARLLARASIQKAIGIGFAAMNESPEWTRNRIRELASSHFANVSKSDEEGELRFDSQTAIDNGALGQIKEIREEVIKVGDSPAKVIKRTVKMHDPISALISLAKMQGILIDRTDVTSGGKPIKAYADIDDGESK